jgi:hypothetical protein
VTAFPLAAATADMAATAAGHAPDDMWTVARELDQLPDIPAHIAAALAAYTTRLRGDYPIHPAVSEALDDLTRAHAELTGLAEQIGPLFRRVHEADLHRGQAPRPGEHLWNVGTDSAGGGSAPAASPLCPTCPADCPRRAEQQDPT